MKSRNLFVLVSGHACMSVCVYVCVCLSVCLCMCACVVMCACPSVFLSICLSHLLSVGMKLYVRGVARDLSNVSVPISVNVDALFENFSPLIIL